MLLLDASVWVLLVDPADRYHRSAVDLIRRQAPSLVALDLTVHEIGNAIGVKRSNPKEAMNVIDLLFACCGDRVASADAGLARLALDVADEHGLAAYDAAYVAAARHHGWTLVSADVADLVSKSLAVTPDAAVYP